MERHYSNVHADVSALADIGLIERTGEGARISWDAVEWRSSTAQAA